MNIYVGNLSLRVTGEELRQEFLAFGEVSSVTVMNDKYIGSGQSRGYAYVEMPSQSEGKAAVASLNNRTLRRMTINVIEALPLSKKKDSSPYNARKVNKYHSRLR
jgi:RNA recognition motif-containing protein